MIAALTDMQIFKIVSKEHIKEFSDGEPIEDEALKCYMNCLFHEVEVVDDTGHVHFEKLINRIPESMKERAMPVITKCQNPVGPNLSVSQPVNRLKL
uniref:Odorant binding protein n=1 Tax=Phlebotomus papatasi TaxID=29031 RepID=A0A1B0DFK8_PHLPP